METLYELKIEAHGYVEQGTGPDPKTLKIEPLKENE